MATGNLPIAAVIQAGAQNGTKDVVLSVAKLIGFVFIGWILYGTGINNYEEPEGGGWSWGFLECWCADAPPSAPSPRAPLLLRPRAPTLSARRYFTMATVTTVGYGDMPRLSQRMRIITIFFGLIGVLVIAESIGVIAEFFVQRAQKARRAPSPQPSPARARAQPADQESADQEADRFAPRRRPSSRSRRTCCRRPRRRASS
jgi:hypothetical protein